MFYNQHVEYFCPSDSECTRRLMSDFDSDKEVKIWESKRGETGINNTELQLAELRCLEFRSTEGVVK